MISKLKYNAHLPFLELGYQRMAVSERSLSEPTEERYSEDQPRDPDGKFAGGGGSPKDQKIGDKVKDVFGNEGTVKGWHGQSGTVQVDVAGKLQYWHPSQLQRGLYVHCGPQGEILFAPTEVRFNPDQSRVPDGKFASGGSGGRVR